MLITETDLQNRYTADVLNQWTDDDRDGVADSAVIAAAVTNAASYVESVIKRGYPDVVPFDDDNVPGVIKDILLSIVGYRLAGRRQKAAEHYKDIYDQAEAALQAIIQPDACIIMPTGDVIYAEGSAEAAADGGIWSSTADKTPVFSDDALAGF